MSSMMDNAPVDPKDKIRISRLEYFVLNNRRFFLKIHTDAGIVGQGEPITEGRARTCAEVVREIEPYLIGKDPRKVTHHWQAIYRHAFYRGGPILTTNESEETGLPAPYSSHSSMMKDHVPSISAPLVEGSTEKLTAIVDKP